MQHVPGLPHESPPFQHYASPKLAKLGPVLLVPLVWTLQKHYYDETEISKLKMRAWEWMQCFLPQLVNAGKSSEHRGGIVSRRQMNESLIMFSNRRTHNWFLCGNSDKMENDKWYIFLLKIKTWHSLSAKEPREACCLHLQPFGWN